MTPTQWERIKGLFAAVAELSPAERSSYLSSACDGDDSTLAEVQRLLRERDGMGDFLERDSQGAALAGLFELHTFASGELVSGRFKIVRFVGKGGMGEVYEAEDLELGRNIALKTIRPEIAADERVIARFKQEIQLSLKVTHPNVCRIYDIERHKPESGPEEARQEVTYLTMELLSGETLAERLRRTGRMPAAEALPVVLEIIDGLQAAHRAGIVHGDLKSSNVMLVPSEVGAVSAVVMDFGLARLTSAPGDEGSRGTGTPAYMAPEQVERGTITTAADIYSLGVVMFEMVTGRLPFHADTPTLIANKRLEEDPPPPRSIVSDLDRRWERAILRCLERSPQDRFDTAADVARFLHRRPWLRVRAPRPRSIITASAVVLLAALSEVGIRAYLVSKPEYKVQLAQARIREGSALEQKGETRQAETAFDEARRLYAAAGNRDGVAEALTESGNLLTDQRDFARANSAYQSALAFRRQIGDQRHVGLVLQYIGVMLRAEGDSTGAVKSYESALAVFNQIDDKREIAITLKDIGGQENYEQAVSIAKQIGDKVVEAAALDDLGVGFDGEGYLAAARKAFEEEASTWREIGAQQYVGRLGLARGNLGDVLYEQGILSEAEKEFQESLGIARQLNDPSPEWQLRNLGELRLQQDRLREARQAFEVALTMAYKSGNNGDVGNARLLLARLSLEENHPEEADAQARQAEWQFRENGSAGEARALAVLAQALAAQRKFRDAESTVKLDAFRPPRIATMGIYGDRLFVRVTLGRVFATTGNAATATKWLKPALDDAKRLGYLGYQLEARLGLGEIAMKSGHAAEGRAQLESLAREANARGFGLISRHAEEAARKTQ